MKKIALLLLAVSILSCSNDDTSNETQVQETLNFSAVNVINENNGIITISSLSAESINTDAVKLNIEFFGESNPKEVNLKNYKIEGKFITSNDETINILGSSGSLDNYETIKKEFYFRDQMIEGELKEFLSLTLILENNDGTITSYTRDIE